MICKDNLDEVDATFNSISSQMKSFDELVIVDSSCSDQIKDFILVNLKIMLVLFMIIFHQMGSIMRKIIASRSHKMIGFVL